MPLSPIEQAAKAARIERDREQLDRALADPNLADARHVYEQYDRINGSNIATSAGPSGATDVAAGIDGSADIEAIKSNTSNLGSILATLNAIATNTAADKFDFIPIEDSTGTVFYNKIDKAAGTVTPLTLALAPYIPVSPVTIVPPDAGKVAISTIYEAITTSSANWTTGQQLRRVESWSLGVINNTLVSSAWINDDTGATLNVIPILGTDVRGEADLTLDTLRQVRDSLLNLETELGNNGDITIPSTNLDPATLKALVRRSNDLIESASPIDTIGSPVDLSIPSNPTQPATLKGLDRGIWQTLLDTIVNTGDPADTTIPATVNDPGTSKGIGRLAINTLLNLIATITNRSQFTRITNGSIDATIKASATAPVGTDPALVVAVSPNSGLVPTGVVVTGETIPSGSGFLGWISSIRAYSILLSAAIGTPADTQATTDTGTFSAIALLKRLNSKLLQGSQSVGSAQSVALARKTTVVGFTTTAALNNNILDPTGAGIATNVLDYNSVEITIIVPGGVSNYILQSAVDSAFTIGITTLTGISIPAGTIAAINLSFSGATVAKYRIDLATANYIRLANINTAAAGVIAYATFSQQPLTAVDTRVAISGGVTTVVATLPNVINAINASVTDALGTIASSATTGAITPTSGLSYQVEFDVTSISGVDTACSLSIQESYNSGSGWRTVYTFEPITFAKGVRVYKSDLLPLTGNRIRYVQTITGTTPSITRQILRTQSNLAVASAIGTRESGGFNVLDLSIYSRTRRILANNRTAAPLFLGVYAKNTALVAGDRPINGQIYLIPASGLSLTSVADWGEHGTVLAPEFANAATPTQVRLGVSSTFARMTIPTGLGTTPNELFSLFVESV